MIRSEWLLKIVLRVTGVACLFATVAVFMPTCWMQCVHEWLGLGELPTQPVVVYLARSTSAFYAILGGLILIISSDIRKYSGIITYVAVIALVFSVVMLVIDVVIKLPMFWIVGEFLSAFPLGVIILVLQRNMGKAEPAAESPQEKEAGQ